MRLIRRHRYFLVFSILLAFCGVMVLRQIVANQAKHVELREAFILLEAKGYKREAERLYQKLLSELEHLPNRTLMDDFQRTLTLIDPSTQQPGNLTWKYHWTVSNELEKRSESTLKRALEIAHEP